MNAARSRSDLAAALLAAVAAAAERLLRTPLDDAAITGLLASLGRAAAASRAYLFALRDAEDGERLADLRLEWCADGITPQIDNQELRGWSFRRTRTEHLYSLLEAGETLSGSPDDFDEPVRSLLRSQQVESIVLTPIAVRGALWGFVGFDDSGQARRWSEGETEALRLVASVLAAAVERQDAERELLAGEESHRDLVESSSDIVWSLDLEGCFVRVNRAFEEFFERPRQEIVGRSWRELIPADQHAAVEVAVRSAHDSRLPDSSYNLRVESPSRGEVWLEVRSRAILRDGRRIGYQGIGRDVTERRRIEERLHQEVRMEAWWRLAAGVARDFDGLMVTIRGYCEAGLARLRDHDALRPELSEILLAAERAAELTRELLAFGRQQPARPVALELTDLLEQRMPLLRRIVGEEIVVVDLVEGELGQVLVDPDLVEQALVALFLSSRDALGDGGRIEIAGGPAEPAEVAGRGAPEAPAAAYIRLTIRDTGPGLPPEAAERLFEPFYSTEALGRGRGLGLSTVYGILRQCDGFVFAASHPGEGISFDLYFPRSATKAVEETKPRQRPAAPEGRPTVLLVEDEDLIRALAEQILADRGYRVVAAADAAEALEIAARLEGELDLLLTDIVMPGVSGSDLATRLQRQYPELKILYMSGYSDNLIFRYGVLQERAAFLQKPFSAEILERKVRDLVGR
jgi:two-component system cell cycle sensor histidine kinase/response regulator CckA